MTKNDDFFFFFGRRPKKVFRTFLDHFKLFLAIFGYFWVHLAAGQIGVRITAAGRPFGRRPNGGRPNNAAGVVGAAGPSHLAEGQMLAP